MTEPHIHTIPVDTSLTVDEAWRELCLMGVRCTDTGSETWANVECHGDCNGIAEADGLAFSFGPPVHPDGGDDNGSDHIRLHDCGRFHRPSEPCTEGGS